MSIQTKTIEILYRQGVSYRELSKRFCLPLSTVYRILQRKEKPTSVRCPECGALIEKAPCWACLLKNRLKQRNPAGREYYAAAEKRSIGRKRKRERNQVSHPKTAATPSGVLQERRTAARSKAVRTTERPDTAIDFQALLTLLTQNPFEARKESADNSCSTSNYDVTATTARQTRFLADPLEDEKADENRTAFRFRCTLELRPREYKRYLEVRERRERQAAPQKEPEQRRVSHEATEKRGRRINTTTENIVSSRLF